MNRHDFDFFSPSFFTYERAYFQLAAPYALANVCKTVKNNIIFRLFSMIFKNSVITLLISVSIGAYMTWRVTDLSKNCSGDFLG